jgi:hypothetical protein
MRMIDYFFFYLYSLWVRLLLKVLVFKMKLRKSSNITKWWRVKTLGLQSLVHLYPGLKKCMSDSWDCRTRVNVLLCVFIAKITISAFIGYYIQSVIESCTDILTTSYWLHVKLGKNI